MGLHVCKVMIIPIVKYTGVGRGGVHTYILDSQKLEKIQRRATRIIPSITLLSYHDRLQHHLPSLQHRRRRGDLIYI